MASKAGWDTSSDEDNGMEIDLDAKTEEDRNQNNSVSQENKGLSEDIDYDPAKPTGDCNPSQPAVNVDNVNQDDEGSYDPAEPTLSDDERANFGSDTDIARQDNSQPDVSGSPDGRWDSQLETSSLQDNISSSPVARVRRDTLVANYDSEKDDASNDRLESSNIERTEELAPNFEQPSRASSPSFAPTDTDDNNTRMSFADGGNSDVPEVTFDESDFVLEKEELESNDSQREKEENVTVNKIDNELVGDNFRDTSQDLMSFDAAFDNELDNHVESNRTQEEVDSRNEEVLVDLFREDSDPDRIENDLEQPQKKTKKKQGSKKLKKKGKKLKKKGKDGLEDQRFVEIRGDRHSLDSKEEGELDGGRGGWTEVDERLAEPEYRQNVEQLVDVSTAHGEIVDDEQREPGEIVEEGSKRKGLKKRDRDKKRKKKSRREVATIDEALQDEDSQKFPSFLAGFFVQDEDAGDEDIADKMDGAARSFGDDGDRTFQKGSKTYRKRHDSGAEDSVKSDDAQGDNILGPELRVDEADHRRAGAERRHISRERRRQDSRDTRDVRRERDNYESSRNKERDRERDRGRSDRDRDRARGRDQREVIRDRDRERSRRDDRRQNHGSRSGSRERRSRRESAERNRRSRERALRHRRHHSRSQERDRERERSRRSQRDRSREREVERRGSGRRGSRSRSRSPRHRSERGGSNKENREESRHGSRRRVISRSHQEIVEDEREVRRSSHHRHQQRENERELDRSPSSSSSSRSSSNKSSSSDNRTDRHNHSRRSNHASDRDHRDRERDQFNEPVSSDEGANSDVILVEPEKIFIDLDDEEDPPSRVDITHANTEDDSTTVVDGESIPPPPDLSEAGSRTSALIQIIQEPAVAVDEVDDGDATPTRDEPTDTSIRRHKTSLLDRIQQEIEAEAGDYDPAHPTDEVEERDDRPASPPEPSESPPPLPPSEPSVPVPPSHPPPQEIRPSPPPPVPTVPETTTRPAMHDVSALQPSLPFPQLAGPPPVIPQGQIFPTALSIANRPTGFLNNQPGLLPTPDVQPLFQIQNESRQIPPMSSMPSLREKHVQNQPPIPISAMAPLAQLTSLLPALDRAKMSTNQNNDTHNSLTQMFKGQGIFPLKSNSEANQRRANPSSESTEVIDMDMSPGEDDCELELPSPNSSESDNRRSGRRNRKSHSSRGTSNKAGGGTSAGPIQPAMYLKALSKAIERLAPKGQQQQSSAGNTTQDKGKQDRSSSKRQQQVEVAADDDVPTSAVELTNKEKYLKKLHFQERVIDEVKLAVKPFYSAKKITKEQYKLILRKAVPKVCHSKNERINPQKIYQLVEAYVGKLAKGGNLDSVHTGRKKKGQPNHSKESGNVTSAKQNGERVKRSAR